ncbi:MAG: glycosyltransferase involved in cell wall biosynthesis [Bacteroidia bacterium]|jgi:glycosyltransferase involved in cell wall biosynthesis
MNYVAHLGGVMGPSKEMNSPHAESTGQELYPRKRVLLGAYACEPGVGSEGGVGWNWTRQIALRNDCTLITRKNNVEEIERAAKAEGLDSLTVIGYDLPVWMRFWKRKSRGALVYYYLWQVGLALVARRLDRQRNFDLVQHITFVTSWMPSGLAFVDKPFVWGPVGQHPRIPRRFLHNASLKTRLIESVKAGIKTIFLGLDPLLAFTMRRANRILSIGSEFECKVDFPMGSKVERMPAVGVEPMIEGRKIGTRVLFSGRLVELKGPELALEAFALAHTNHKSATLTFLGDGPLKSQLEQRAVELGVQDAVCFPGMLPHEQALDLMATADVFLFPSFEGAGMVVPEAMAAGAVVLCLDFGGPGDMVAGERGIAAELGDTKQQTCANLADGLNRLLGSAVLRDELRLIAKQWVESEMLWHKKGERMQQIHSDVMQEVSRK